MKSKAFDKSKYENWINPADVVPYERNAKSMMRSKSRILLIVLIVSVGNRIRC